MDDAQRAVEALAASADRAANRLIEQAVGVLAVLVDRFVDAGSGDMSLLGDIYDLVNDLDGWVADGGWVPPEWERVRCLVNV